MTWNVFVVFSGSFWFVSFGCFTSEAMAARKGFLLPFGLFGFIVAIQILFYERDISKEKKGMLCVQSLQFLLCILLLFAWRILGLFAFLHFTDCSDWDIKGIRPHPWLLSDYHGLPQTFHTVHGLSFLVQLWTFAWNNNFITYPRSFSLTNVIVVMVVDNVIS